MLNIYFVLGNNADSFNWVFTFCQNSHLGVSGLQRAKHMVNMCRSRGGTGVRTPLKNHINIGFSSNTGPDLLKNSSYMYQASIQCRTIIGTPAKRHLMEFRWRADGGSSLPSSTKKSCQSWTPSDKTFWIRAW